MTQKKITDILLDLHRKYTCERKTTLKSTMFTLWSMDDPPDVLLNTPQLDEMEELFNCVFDEDAALTFYDMTIEEAGKYIFDYINEMD